jgi:hypothetical protein
VCSVFAIPFLIIMIILLEHLAVCTLIVEPICPRGVLGGRLPPNDFLIMVCSLG